MIDQSPDITAPETSTPFDATPVQQTPINQTPVEPTPVVPSSGPRVLTAKIFGIGGAGCNAADHLARSNFNGTFYAINTDAQALDKTGLQNKTILGTRRTRGIGTGGDPELGRIVAQEDVANLKSLTTHADLVFILCGLGGGTGTGAAPILAQAAKENGALVLAIVTTPFDFEGNRRQAQAQTGLQALTAAADAVICLPNQKLFKILDENTSFVDLFKTSNEMLADAVRGVWRLLTDSALKPVDFADLCSVTRARHAESAFAIVQGVGDTRVDQVVEKLLAHPLLDAGEVLAQSDAVLVSLVGGADLSMGEVNRLMTQINRHCEKANLVFGASINDCYQNKLSLTLIASRSRKADLKPEPALSSDRATSPAQLGLDRSQFLDTTTTQPDRRVSRVLPPAPELTEDARNQIIGKRGRKKMLSRQQKELPLEIVSKGRFDKSEPTVRGGEDLDMPTYIRRGVALN
ncbi:MAG: Cell division protein FtsZ [Verrucomicrobiales bacterium]|nr:Cell division protein FtsZ [Verrucomicrobiales bacterium]